MNILLLYCILCWLFWIGSFISEYYHTEDKSDLKEFWFWIFIIIVIGFSPAWSPVYVGWENGREEVEKSDGLF